MYGIDLFFTGLTLGGLYALIAMGLTLQFGVARIMNLSYGEFMIAASFAALLLVNLGVNPILSLIIMVPAGFALHWLIYQVLMLPLVKRASSGAQLEVDSILATFGILFVAQGIMLVMFGGNYFSYSFMSFPVHLFGANIAANRLLVLVCAVVIGGGLYLLMTRTRMGMAMRAVATAPNFAPLVGINVTRVSAAAFATGGAMLAASGVLISMFLPFTSSMGVLFTMKALVVVIMGGIGNLMGCLVAGMLLGFTEALVSRYIDPGLTLAANYALFLLVLLFLPNGLFGRTAK
ncbi:branched-chain amino acid ABC transporter permease [Halomonas sp. MES3-P3E]|uniref:branched-chain amino acid ABC transporter permease n=1 Tax=Halomonas sp. MES3-P3E TaxID=2058321 RepID=UPI000C34A8C7|nr:branched-chain amino acid ABC transporter permease [Halomonas sp. MES3-P3E]PKG54216.1 branched-chain amino acid ABC transporter permease [Halomonas sp. MES3-P3E]|tara:strand:+ start:4596 stop:5468 length:873 start_codon:yes stop_codon:yes gene_type:complete